MTVLENKIAVIDLGSNSVRLVIYETKENGAFKLIDDISNKVRLSENMIEGRFLNDIAMGKAIKTIKLFRTLCSAYKISQKNIIAVATAAVRKAENRNRFLDMLYKATGLKFRVLSGDEEAQYVYKAVMHSMKVDEGIIVDIGGGSTEIIYFKNNSAVNFTSIPIGSIVATEEFLDRDIVASEKLVRLEEYIESLVLKHAWFSQGKVPTIIGLGGTIRNFAKIHKKRIKYNLEQMHNYNIDINDFYNIFDDIKVMDMQARKKVKGMSLKRADIIIGGLAILNCISRLVGADTLVISGDGLREGILYEYLSQNMHPRYSTDILSSSIENCMDIYGIRKFHAYHVHDLALSIFDQLRDIHLMGEEEKRLLIVASLLHDVGISVNYYGHYSHSFYIIINSRLNGLTHREIVLTAAIAASHGFDKFRDDWQKQYKGILRSTDIEIFNKLSMFLRIAECLDRSENGIIKSIECETSGNAVTIRTASSGDPELEVSQASANSEDFVKLFGRRLHVI